MAVEAANEGANGDLFSDCFPAFQYGVHLILADGQFMRTSLFGPSGSVPGIGAPLSLGRSCPRAAVSTPLESSPRYRGDIENSYLRT